MKMLKRIYVWEFPVRFTHWINVLALLFLGITGYYISNPFFYVHIGNGYSMGTVRFVHYVSAYVFVVSLAIRIYWALAGNAYANWRAFFPFTPEKSMEIIRQMRFYSFIDDRPRLVVGHNALAGLIYLIVFILYLVQICTGFALYSVGDQRAVFGFLFGWVLAAIGAPAARLVHHVTMWLLLYFIMIHIYISIFLDAAEKSGLVGSIFTGYKFVYPEVKKR